MEPLDKTEILDLIKSSEIDTVIVAFPDLQGRIVGKRVTSNFYINSVRHHGIEACDYLLAVDIELNPVEGYRFANWEQGYGDMLAVPDESTLKIVPWLEKTAFVICDLYDHQGNPVEVSPRWILKNQIKKAQNLGYNIMTATELEFFLFKDSFKKAQKKKFKGLSTISNNLEDYQIYETTKEEFMLKDIRNFMQQAGLKIEFSKGEAGKGQHEINITYTNALECADNHLFFKNGVKEIAALKDMSVSFMAKHNIKKVGSSCHIHASLWDINSNQSLMSGDYTQGLSHLAASFIQGLIDTTAEFMILWAPNVNSYKRYQPGSWAPTTLGWAPDNRTVTHRLVGKNNSLRIESRVPGADCNPYLALSGILAGGIYGIENNLALSDPLKGNAYLMSDAKHLPYCLIDAVKLFENSLVAKSSFGDDVHYHLLNMAYREWLAFNNSVTDWELKRYFEKT